MSPILPSSASHDQTGSPFEAIRHVDQHGEHWFGRDLMPQLGYDRWQRFADVIDKAKASAVNVGADADSMFVQVNQVTEAGNLGNVERTDYRLTRYACYLIAQNGDPRKPEIAAAQTYFAVRTSQSEAIETRLAGMSDWVRQQMDTLMQIGEIEAEQKRQDAQLQKVTARVDTLEGNHDWFSALGYAKLHDLTSESGYLKRVGTVAGRILRAAGDTPGKTQHPAYGSVGTYPAWVLEQAFSEVSVRA